MYVTATRGVRRDGRGDGGGDEADSDSVADNANDVCSTGELVALVSHVGAADR